MYKLENNVMCIEVAAHGAEVQRIYHKTYQIDYLWHGDAHFWGRRSPVLFPIVGRLMQHAYTFNGHIYAMDGHGFARDKTFTLVKQTANTLVFCLRSDEETLAIYPFEFELYCEYTLEQTQLSVVYTIVNVSDKQIMYYSIGAHPAFSTKLQATDKFEDYTLSIQTSSPLYQYALNGMYLNQASKTLVNVTSIPLTYDLFSNDALIFETEKHAMAISLTSNQHKHGVCVSYDNNPFVGIWTPYPKQAPFVCIEPWQGVADVDQFDGDLSQKFAINTLMAQQ